MPESMPYSRRIYEMLPVFARMADEERGLLRHICDWGIQPELDNLYSKIQLQEYYYNPDHPASWDHLDWLGQFVGLGILDGHWLGVGLNPNWSVAAKVDIIKRTWNYWQIKGSEAGIREAIAMWLRFEDRSRLLLDLPFGRTPTDEPPNWHGWNTPYDVSLNQTFPEKQRMGWGNYWGTHYQPDYFTLQAEWTWEWGVLGDGEIEAGELWQDRDDDIPALNYIEPPDLYLDRSRMGDRELWMHFYLKENEWNRIFPDIFELNLETLPVTTTAAVFGWLQGIRQPAIQPLTQTPRSIDEQTVTEFEFDGMQWGQLLATENWQLPDDAWAYGGTLWPFEVTDPYATTETIESKIEWGVWEPEWWDGQPWGAVIGGAANHESLSIFVDLGPIATLTGETLSINTQELSSYTEIAPTYWYAPWEERTITETVVSQYPGTGCLEGIPIKFDDTSSLLHISLGRSLSKVTNQLFVPSITEGEPQFVSSEDIKQSTLSISFGRSGDEGFSRASLREEETAGADWVDASFLDLEPFAEPDFQLGHADQSPQPQNIEPISTGGFEAGWVQEDYPTSEGFVSANAVDETAHESVPEPESADGFEQARTHGNYPVPEGFEDAVITEDRLGQEPDFEAGYVEPVFQPVSFESGYVERSIQVEGFEPGNIEGFEPGRIQGNYPVPEGFEDAAIAEDTFIHETLTTETLKLEEGIPRGWKIPTTRTQLEILEPIEIATYGGDYEEYPYYYDSGFTGEVSEVADPVETLTINTSGLSSIETLQASPEIDGYLCNVFGGWSSLTPTNIKQYKVEIPEGDHSLFDAYPLLAQAHDGEKWKLLVETEEEHYILRPVTMFWKERGRTIPVGEGVRRSQVFSFEEGFTDLYLEFVFQPKTDTYIQSASLSLFDKLIQHQNYYYKLNAPDEAYIGFVFDVPFRLPSGAESPEEEVLLEEILPSLTSDLLQLAGLPTNSGLIPAPVITTLPTEPAVQPESLKEILRSLRDLIRDKAGDKHFPYAIETPSTVVRIEHNLGKHPAVTFVDTVDGAGYRSEGDVEYVDRNTAIVSFSEPTIGRVFFN